MPSQAQIDANRLNSQKSTGPTSPEGKAAASLNALKSGIHARPPVRHPPRKLNHIPHQLASFRHPRPHPPNSRR